MIPSLAGVVHLLSFGMVCFPIVYSQGCAAGFCCPTRFEQRPSARSDLHPLVGSMWGLCWRIFLPTVENLQQRNFSCAVNAFWKGGLVFSHSREYFGTLFSRVA